MRKAPENIAGAAYRKASLSGKMPAHSNEGHIKEGKRKEKEEEEK